jgi:transposase-like protein
MTRKAAKMRWTADKKADAVLRLLKGETLDAVSRDLGLPGHELETWRSEFISQGKEGLRSKPRTQDDRKLDEAQKVIGQLTMENAILKPAVELKNKRSFPQRRSLS